MMANRQLQFRDKLMIKLRIFNAKKKNYFEGNLLHMNDKENLFAFLEGFGFAEEELRDVMAELDAYRSIPGTTLGRYINRAVNTLAVEERPAFLKGVIIGVAIRKAVDALGEPDTTDEEKRIDSEIERLRHALK